MLCAGVVLLACRSVVETVRWWRLWLTNVVAVGAFVSLSNVYVGLVALAATV